MVCSGAYPEAPRCPMLSTVESSVLGALSGAAPAVGAPSRTTSINMANERTIVTLDRCTLLSLLSNGPYRRSAASPPRGQSRCLLPYPPTASNVRLSDQPPSLRSGQLRAEAVVGRGLEVAHAVPLRDLGQLPRDPGRQFLRWRGDRHLALP